MIIEWRGVHVIRKEVRLGPHTLVPLGGVHRFGGETGSQRAVLSSARHSHGLRLGGQECGDQTQRTVLFERDPVFGFARGANTNDSSATARLTRQTVSFVLAPLYTRSSSHG